MARRGHGPGRGGAGGRHGRADIDIGPADRGGDRNRRCITSLGSGSGQLARADPGHSGIRRISRFPIGGLRTNIAGTVDFIPVTELSAPALSERLAELVIEEAIAEAGIGTPGDFPGPMFMALPPVEMEWPQRIALPPLPARTRR